MVALVFIEALCCLHGRVKVGQDLGGQPGGGMEGSEREDVWREGSEREEVVWRWEGVWRGGDEVSRRRE